MSEPMIPWDDLYRSHFGEQNRRLADALERRDADGLVIFAGIAPLRWRDDIAYPFHAEPYFLAWAPLPAPAGCWLKLTPGQRPLLVFLQLHNFWQAPVADPDGPWVAHYEIVYAREPAVARQLLGDCRRYDALGSALDEASFASVNDPSLLAHLDYYRAFKTEYEQACIAAANTLAVRGHTAVRAAFLEAPCSEFELQRRYGDTIGQLDFEQPYPSIVALNEHAAVLHYDVLERAAPAVRRALLIDAGARYAGYAADVSRTWVGPDEGQGGFAALLDAMDSLQRRLCAEVTAGLDFVALNDAAHQGLASVLHECGLIRCTAEEALEAGITRTFLPHGLGHLLGLRVHDAGGWLAAPDGEIRRPPPEHPFLRLTRPLAPGFVLTIEPGIYFIPSLLGALAREPAGRKVDWTVLERLAGCGGIRIEDNVLVTTEGAVNLTRAAFDASDESVPSG